MYPRSTLYKRRAVLREAGYVLADEWMEPTTVDLGEVLERCLEETVWDGRSSGRHVRWFSHARTGSDRVRVTQ
jgi:hypothetical protein